MGDLRYRAARVVVALCVLSLFAACSSKPAPRTPEPPVVVQVTEAPAAAERPRAEREYAEQLEDDEQAGETDDRVAAITTGPARSITDDLVVVPDGGEPVRYDRRQWRHWIDADGDCQDTRQEVLIAESEVPVTFTDNDHCRVRTGQWTCPYTGKTFTDPRKLDVDHFVPLGNAAASGGGAWSRERKSAYANDLDDPEHLVAVAAAANRSKGKKGPEAWLPDRTEYRCDYVRTWVRIKKRWHLHATASERAAIDRVLNGCAKAETSAPARTVDGSESPAPPVCCRRCKSGCPCGDSCVPCSARCTKPPGCACKR